MINSQEAGLTLACLQPGSSSRRFFSIGQLAKEFGLTLRALRFYEDRGLLRPKREGNLRLYTPVDRERLRVILKAKALGFTLSEIKDTLASADAHAEPSLALSASQVADQIAHLEQQHAEVSAALAELHSLRALLPNASARVSAQ
jgi:DNA-binding transcriptional MerR regulator